MIPVWQIPRLSLLWLIVAYLAVVMLHFEHLPAWIAVAASIVIIWRIQCYRGVWPPPGRLVKIALTLLCVAGLFNEYGRLIGLGPMVALLVSAFSLKLLEMQHKRDARLVIYLAFFLAALQGLFDQTIPTAITILGCFIVITAALVALHRSSEQGALYQPLKVGVGLLLQALPLMIILFLVMPRLGALWSVPINSHSAKTGVSDTMSPGDFSKLGRSADIAFRVTFEGEAPPQHQLYWRGLVLSNFDGRKWSSAGPDGFSAGALLQWHGEQRQPWDSLVKRQGSPVRYSVIMEPSNQIWLYGLSTPLPASSNIAFTRDFRLVARQPVEAKTLYQAESWLTHKLNPQALPYWRRAVELSLPEGFNPRTVELAQRWQQQGISEREIIRRALNLFNERFVYTLQAPLLGKHTVDEFLFDTQRGFCEHFSSSFVFLMRAAGIPARVVAGYQGGEKHPDDNYWLIRQYDAHAWAEVWLPDEGWRRVDPTAAVAPERVETSLADILGAEEAFLADSPLSLMNVRHIPWLNRLRLQIDSLNYAWATWVLGYDDKQNDFLHRWLGGNSPARIGMFLLTAGGVIVISLALWQLRRTTKPKYDELDQTFLGFCKKLEKAGLQRRVGEGPKDYGLRVAELQPTIAGQVKNISDAYEQMRYQTGPIDQQAYRQFRQAVKKLKVR